MIPFTNSLDHILSELTRLDLLIRVEVWRARQVRASYGDGQGELHPYYVPDGEIDLLLDKALGAPLWDMALPAPDDLAAIRHTLAQQEAAIAEATDAALGQGIELRLAKLATDFALSPFDLDALLLCLAPELDLRYGRLYAYLHDEVSRTHPTVELLLNLLCPDLTTRLAAQARLTADAPLRHHGLLQMVTDPADLQPPLLAQTLKLDERIRRYLLAPEGVPDTEMEERLRSYATLTWPTVDLAALHLPAAQAAQLARVSQTAGPGVLYVAGPDGVGKATAAAALAHHWQRPLLTVNGAGLVTLDLSHFRQIVTLLLREARLQGALLCWRAYDALLAAEREPLRAHLLTALAAWPDWCVLCGETVWEAGAALGTMPFVQIALPLPTTAERAQLWADRLNGRAAAADVAAVAAAFRLTGGQIRDAAATARHLAQARDPQPAPITRDDLFSASRRHSNQKLATLAQKIDPHYTWADIVLPATALGQLHDLCHQVAHRAQVYETWGFGRKLALGKGLHALFTGPPGTGKTMAADILAGALGLDLYKIDLATVVSKYIGETEKNLARIFAEAATSNALLFFDEADALFGKRTEVRDAHDRYANLEISYLLQKMDEYEGVVILATNLRQNMDKAFVRRLHFIIDFPAPDMEQRRRIWQGIWPAAAPCSPDLDLTHLATQFEVTGAHIRNIALAAAFQAAAEETGQRNGAPSETNGDPPAPPPAPPSTGAITMRHILHAAAAEYQKMGKWLTGDGLGTGGNP
jgi:SpoVK/Ycf46/Vps4 family AAA+-type ATPase